MTAAPPGATAVAPAPVPRPSMSDLASRLGEVVVLVAAILFGLGAFSVLGQLRRLDLHQPSVLGHFAHDDVLMKGIGVLLTNVPNFVALVALVTLALSTGARAWLVATITPGGDGRRGDRVGLLAFAAVLFVGAILVSNWWGGTAGIVVTYGVVLAAWLRGRLLTPQALLGVAAAGSILLGVTGTYLYPVPLPTITVEAEEAGTIEGSLLGSSQDGELYVVVLEDGEHHVRVVDRDSASSIVLDDPAEDGQRVVDHID